MKNNKGITLVALTITIVVLIIIASITVNLSTQQIHKGQFADIKTNMLQIQAKAKSVCEEVTFQTANLDSSKQEDANKIAEIKANNLVGTALSDCSAEIQGKARKMGITDFANLYFLNKTNIKEDLGININIEEKEYYIVKYDMTDLEVFYSEGFKSNDGKIYYKLSEMNDLVE